MHDSKISGIVLLAKQPGITSFSSLYTVKKALGTKKVGHTGTLDSFAQGLLVVCVGNLTRLSQKITGFDKEYEAVIEFGTETDTLDPTGNVIRTTGLPTYEGLKKSLEQFNGKIMQRPPVFSALHADGKRASDLCRQGQTVELESRPVTVFSHEILEVHFETKSEQVEQRLVKYARVRFCVSKGTYIRSLARDIGIACGSSAHLAGLLRTKVGSFCLEDAAGAGLLNDFTIKNVLENLSYVPSESSFDVLKSEIPVKLRQMTPELASDCSMKFIFIHKGKENHFYTGKPLFAGMFDFMETGRLMERSDIDNAFQYAVFTMSGVFAGIVHSENSKLKYSCVIPCGESAE